MNTTIKTKFTCPLPAFVPGGLAVPTALASALMQFASPDMTRVHMSGLGLDDCHVSASDGASGVRVLGIDPAGQVPTQRDGSWWPGTVVKDAIARAREAKAPAIFLAWSECGDPKRPYPPLGRVMADHRRGAVTGAVGLDGTILGRLEALCKAVQGRWHRDCPSHSCAFTFGGPLDPVLVKIEKAGSPTVEVVIMPTRL